MSQQKVDKYKKEKANRAKLQKREHRILFLEKLAGAVICLAVVAWIGYSVYGFHVRAEENEEKEVVTTEMDITALSDYLTELSQETTEE